MVDQVLNQLVALVLALALGLVLGFFFERRQGRETRRQNKELRAELESMGAELASVRASVYTVGGSDKPPREKTEQSLPPDKLVVEVMEYAKAIQDAQGRVRRSLLVEHFTSNGHLPGPVNQALDLAQESGALSVDEMWVTIR